MTIATVYFENEENPQAFKRVLDVYEYSVRKYLSESNLIINKVEKTKRRLF